MEKTVNIDRKALLEAYNNADDSGKKVLTALYGGKTFEKDITERVKSFEEACSILNLAVADVLGMYDTPDVAAYKKLKVIAQALNEGWKPDWLNSEEYKYYPWFKANASGSGLSYYDFVIWYSDSSVPACLCYRTKELAEYAGKQFEDIYSIFLK